MGFVSERHRFHLAHVVLGNVIESLASFPWQQATLLPRTLLGFLFEKVCSVCEIQAIFINIYFWMHCEALCLHKQLIWYIHLRWESNQCLFSREAKYGLCERALQCCVIGSFCTVRLRRSKRNGDRQKTNYALLTGIYTHIHKPTRVLTHTQSTTKYSRHHALVNSYSANLE